MKNVKNVHFWQVDNKIKNIFTTKGIIVLPSFQAWGKFSWTRKFFKKKPKEGYFVWVKENINFPLTTCVDIASSKITQNLNNLLVIEKGIKVKANVFCQAIKKNLCGTHQAQGKMLLKQGASLDYNHNHLWGENDFVKTDYQFILEKNSQLSFIYKNQSPPKNLELKEAVLLEGENSQCIIRLRLVGKKNSQITAKSSIVAKSSGKGHLDCQGLLVDKNSTISLTPELICKHPKAQITHEASIGKISEEELNYLRMRGLTEKEAIDLIISGFLKI